MRPRDALTLINCLLVWTFKSVCRCKQIKCIRGIFCLFHAAVKDDDGCSIAIKLYYTSVFLCFDSTCTSSSCRRPMHLRRCKIQLFINGLCLFDYWTRPCFLSAVGSSPSSFSLPKANTLSTSMPTSSYYPGKYRLHFLRLSLRVNIWAPTSGKPAQRLLSCSPYKLIQ